MTKAQASMNCSSACSRHWGLVIGISLDIGHSLGESSEQTRHGFGLDEFARLIEVVQDNGVRIDAHGMIDRRQQLDGMHRGFSGRRAGGVRFAVKSRALDSCAGGEGCVTIWPVVAAIRRVPVAGSAHPEARTAPDLATGICAGVFPKSG